MVLVYGKPKRLKNPSQRFLQWRGDDHGCVLREWDFWMGFYPRVNRIRSKEALRMAAKELDERGIECLVIRDQAIRAIAKRARAIGLTRLPEGMENDERIYRKLLIIENKGKPPKAKKGAKKSPKKSKKRKAPTYIKLRTPPEKMVDPGPVAWLGSTLEFGWEKKNGQIWKKTDEHGTPIWTPRSEWMFTWSPKYKGIVSIKKPRNMYKLAEVDRYGNAAKMFEVFTARPAENTFVIYVPEYKLQEVGKKAAHIVYRSDKWSAKRRGTDKRLEVDYIHELEKGVRLFVGPSIEKPEVFFCYGGRLTLTERGLVY